MEGKNSKENKLIIETRIRNMLKQTERGYLSEISVSELSKLQQDLTRGLSGKTENDIDRLFVEFFRKLNKSDNNNKLIEEYVSKMSRIMSRIMLD